MQTVPDRPVGLHRSLPIVAWVEWKLVMVLKGKWNFRSCDSKTKSYTEQLAATKKCAIKGGKYLKYNKTSKVMEVNLQDQVAAAEAAGPGEEEGGTDVGATQAE